MMPQRPLPNAGDEDYLSSSRESFRAAPRDYRRPPPPRSRLLERRDRFERGASSRDVPFSRRRRLEPLRLLLFLDLDSPAASLLSLRGCWESLRSSCERFDSAPAPAPPLSRDDGERDLEEELARSPPLAGSSPALLRGSGSRSSRAPFASSAGALLSTIFNSFCCFALKKCMLASTIFFSSLVDANLGSVMTVYKLAAFKAPVAACMRAIWNHSFRVSASMLSTCSGSVEINSSFGASFFLGLGASLREKQYPGNSLSSLISGLNRGIAETRFPLFRSDIAPPEAAKRCLPQRRGNRDLPRRAEASRHAKAHVLFARRRKGKGTS